MWHPKHKQRKKNNQNLKTFVLFYFKGCHKYIQRTDGKKGEMFANNISELYLEYIKNSQQQMTDDPI